MADPAVPPTLADRFVDIDGRIRQVERMRPWYAATLSGLWVNYNVGFEAAAFRKVDDIVYIRGLVKRSSGSPSANETIMVLPLNYRPGNGTFMYTCPEAVGMSRVDILGNGNVNFVAGNPSGAATFLSLNTLFFSTTVTSTLTPP